MLLYHLKKVQIAILSGNAIRPNIALAWFQE